MKRFVILGAFLATTFACTKGKEGGTTGGSTQGAGSEAYEDSEEKDANSNGGSGDATGENGGAGDGNCRIALDCVQTLPELPEAVGFSSLYNKGLSKFKPVHRARDVVAVEGAPVILQAKFTYGLTDADLKEEMVDIYLAQGCGADWKKIGSIKTSKENEFPTVEGVEDSGGRIYADLSKFNVTLPIGRHRVLLVVQGDNSTADMYVDVLPKTAKIVLTDIDGTLTTSEFAAATEIISVHPESHEGVADMMRAFFHRGYHIFYLTARPEWLMSNTRDWINIRGLPPGTIHTSPFTTGAQGDAAAEFKNNELKFLKENTGIVPSYAFGNKPSDVKAFGSAGIEPKNSYYFNLGEDAGGGTDHSSYRGLVPVAQAAPSVCP